MTGGLLPDWISLVIMVITSILGALGILGKTMLGFMEKQQVRNDALNREYVASLTKQATDNSTERIQNQERQAEERRMYYGALEKFAEALREHTADGKQQQHILESIRNQQAVMITKMQDVADAIKTNGRT